MIGLVYILRWQPIGEEDQSKLEAVSNTTNLSQNYLTDIRNILIERFNEEELRTLIMDLGIDYEVLPSKSKAELARELVAYLARRNQIQRLVNNTKVKRPDIDWPIDLG